MRQDVGSHTKKTGSRRPGRREKQRIESLFEGRGNTMVLATISSVVLATLLSVKLISPLLFTLAVFPFFYKAIRHNDYRLSIVLISRWAITLFVTLLAVGVFVPGRLGSSLPFADSAVATLETWLRDPTTSPPANLGYILWGMAAFLVGSVVSGGFLGILVGSVALGGTAYVALFVFRHGINIIQIALVAVPLWQLSLFVTGAFLLAPMSIFMFDRFFHIERRYEEREMLRHYMYIGAGFFVLSILLRYAAAGLWRVLIERWTVL